MYTCETSEVSSVPLSPARSIYTCRVTAKRPKIYTSVRKQSRHAQRFPCAATRVLRLRIESIPIRHERAGWFRWVARPP